MCGVELFDIVFGYIEEVFWQDPRFMSVFGPMEAGLVSRLDLRDARFGTLYSGCPDFPPFLDFIYVCGGIGCLRVVGRCGPLIVDVGGVAPWY